MDESERIVCGEYTFEVINEIPCGYEFWNIGKNMTEGYLPLCRISAKQPFPGGRCVDTDNLKAIKLDGAQTVLAASIRGHTTVEAMEKYLARNQGKKVSGSTLKQIKRVEAALEALKEIRRPTKQKKEAEQIPACRFERGDKVKIPYICDGDSRNHAVGEVTWIHPYKYYPDGDRKYHVWKYQMEITYPDGQSVMVDPDRKASGAVSEVVLVERKAPRPPLESVIQSAAAWAARGRATTAEEAKIPEPEI